jgi:hypothetical protein
MLLVLNPLLVNIARFEKPPSTWKMPELKVVVGNTYRF